MEFFYQSGAMGFRGEGYLWHKVFRYNFPKFPIITKTITLNKKIGLPFAIVKIGNSVWNKNGLHNPGIKKWFAKYYTDNRNVILSIHGTDNEVQEICNFAKGSDIQGIELNYSCPNVESPRNKRIPSTHFPLYLKLNCRQDPYHYDLDNIKRIHLNSIPKFFGGVSGKAARKENWEFIKKFIGEGLDVAGCSIDEKWHIKYLEYDGCKSIGIGSVILTNPWLVMELENYNE